MLSPVEVVFGHVNDPPFEGERAYYVTCFKRSETVANASSILAALSHSASSSFRRPERLGAQCVQQPVDRLASPYTPLVEALAPWADSAVALLDYIMF